MNELGFTEDFLKWYMSDSAWMTFQSFMRGQTTAQVGEEKTYYYWDVSNFCETIGYTYPDQKNFEEYKKYN